MWWGVHEGMGWWMLFGGIWMVLFWGAVVAMVVWGLRSVFKTDGRAQEDDPYTIARRRYARGEITREQLDDISATLRRQ